MNRLLALAVVVSLFGCSPAPGPVDSGTVVDAGTPDAGTPDAGTLDSGTPDAGTPDSGTPDAGPACTLEAGLIIPSAQASLGVLVDAGTFVLNGVARPYQLLKLPGADGKTVYAQWVPAGDGGPMPALLLASPYDGIEWSGEEVDNKLTADGGCGVCLLPDTYGPATFPDAGEIYYGYQPAQAMAAGAGIYQLNGLSVLYVFGRHYAGSGFFQQGQAMAAGLRFLEHMPDVDKTRLGMFGGSLGGFEVLEGAAFAPAGAQPKVMVALYPLNDVPLWLKFINEDLPPQLGTNERRAQFARFLEPYQRRIAADSKGNLGCFTNTFYASRITGHVLVIQDAWDMLVPASSSKDLLTRLGSHGSSLFYEHIPLIDRTTVPMSHVLDQEATYASNATFSLAYLINTLSTQTQIYLPYSVGPMRAFLTRVRDLQRGGFPQPGVAARLLDIADPRVQMYELSLMTFTPGAEYLAGEINTVFGTTFTAAQIASELQTNGLPP